MKEDVNWSSLNTCNTVVELVNNLLSHNERQIAICNWVFSGSGGVSRVVEQQARDLSKAGYKVTIFALVADMDPPEGVELLTLSTLPQNPYLQKVYLSLHFLDFLSGFKAARKLKEYDLVICHLPPAPFLGYLAERLHKVKYIYWFHYYPDSSLFSSLAHKLWLKWSAYLQTRSPFVKGAELICSVSEASKNKLKDKSGLDSFVIPNKADVERFKEVDIAQLREKYGLSEDDRIILFVGRITPQKNVHSLIQVFTSLNEAIPSLKLILVGNVSIKQYFERLKELANDNVIFTGFVPDEELSGFYYICDIYATCSLSEGWNVPPAEAQGFGKPVVAFNIPEQREVVKNGWLVEPNNYEEFKAKIINCLEKRR